MKINKKVSKRNRVGLVALFFVVLLLSGVILSSITFGWPINKSFFGQQPSRNTESQQNKSDEPPNSVSSPRGDNDKSGKVYEDEPADKSEEGSLNITKLSQDSESILIEASVRGMSSGGQCNAYLTSEVGSDVVSKSLSIKKVSENLTCEASVPENEFSYLGTWNARITYSVSNNIAEDTRSLTIE